MPSEEAIRGSVKPKRVFISHASADKKRRIRPIVDALVRLEFDLFVDAPRNLGRGVSDLDNRVDFIRPGKTWRDELERGLFECDATLGCFSAAMLEERRVLQEEITYSKTARKLVACVVDDTPPARVKPGGGIVDLSAIQAPPLDTDALRAFLAGGKPKSDAEREAQKQAWDDLLTLAQELIDRAAARAQEDPPDPLGGRIEVREEQLCRIDRTPQRTTLFLQMAKVRERRRPHAVVLAGPSNELIAEFIRHVRVAEGAGGEDAEFDWRRVEWPDTRSATPFSDQFRMALAEALGVSKMASLKELADALAQAPTVIVPYTVASADDLTESCLEKFDDWLEVWRVLHGSSPRMPALPTLLVELPKAPPSAWPRDASGRVIPRTAAGWRGWFGGGARVSNQALVRRLEAMAAAHDASEIMSVAFPDLAGPIRPAHVTRWIGGQDDLTAHAGRFTDLFAGRLPAALDKERDVAELRREFKAAPQAGLSLETLRRAVSRLNG